MNEQTIVLQIKKSKKYRNIASSIIEKEADNYFRKNPGWQNYKEKFILKEIKARLHDMHGSFQTNNNKKSKYLEELKNNPDNLEIINNLLKTNKSTKERLDDYEEIYDKIFEITGEPASIVDLGCGLNPLSAVFMGVKLNKLKDLNYYAYDINEKDSDMINKFFRLMKIQGKSEVLDCSNIENLKKIPGSDLVFMFKFIDTIENNERGHKLAEEIIRVIADKAKHVVVSFSTYTLGGKRMNFPARGWIERMLQRVGLRFEKLEFKNEVFYIISR